MTPAGKPITFLAAGAPPATPGEAPRNWRLKQSLVLGARRGGGDAVRVSAVPGEDVVVLHIAGGPSLMLHPETARDLLMAQDTATESRGSKEVMTLAPGEVAVPARLRWQGAEGSAATRGGARGAVGDVLLAGIDVITGLFPDNAAGFAASGIVQLVDAQVDPGMYRLQPESLLSLKGAAKEAGIRRDKKSVLALVHGTFSTTSGTFSKLWTQHPQRVRRLFEGYDGHVYALDHPTLGVSPIGNALSLVRALADGARLDLATHSRGGLVAEVLARVCADPDGSVKAFAKLGNKSQRDELAALAAQVKAKNIKVARVVRVACPARGTLLASKRLDAYISMFKWTLELAGVPVAPVLVDFLGQVAKHRADPDEIPGLAAQMPDSPLVQWLHTVNERIPGDLRVVAGDIEGDSVTSWLKTLLADAFYWTDNDFVVQTRSMYGGGPRESGAQFFLDQGGNVSHFSYFQNERTAAAIVGALLDDEPQGFRPIGPLSWAGQSSTGVRARVPGMAAAEREAREKPAVFIIPGILGSNLKIKDERVWLGWRIINGLDRLAYRKGDPVEPDGPIGMYYDDLADFLSRSHEVLRFAFDWRRPIEDEARRLADDVEAALDARKASGRPVRILAHSMGGLVSRTMQLERPAVWNQMMAVPGARLLMLGTPNGGSWAPMQVLSGDDTFGNVLAAVGAPFHDHAARQLMAQFPGFIQLQAALLDEKLGLARKEAWARLAAEDLKRLREHSLWHRLPIQLKAYEWGVPEQAVLDRAVDLRKRLDLQREKALPSFSEKLVLVVGRARFTPDGFEVSDEGLVYLDTPEEGDGRVPLRSAVMPGVRAWRLDCEHGSLPNKKEAFEAYLELLEQGSTNRLAPLGPSIVSRGGEAQAPAQVRSRPSRDRVSVTPAGSKGDLYATGTEQPKAGPAAAGTALRVTVVHGDLTFVRQPLLIGHYRSSRLTGAEAVMNRILDKAMQDSLHMGLYPVAPGTHQVFWNRTAVPDNPWQMPRPEAVIVVGLGDEGQLRPTDLVHTVRQAVIAWVQRRSETTRDVPALVELAATLAGSGGYGMDAGQSAQLVARGVREANERLADTQWPLVGHLHLIELYLNRAGEAWRALQTQALSSPGQYLVTGTVRTATGGFRRPLDDGYRGATSDFISAVFQKNEDGDPQISYTMDTRRARAEVTAQATQVPLMRQLVATAANDRNRDPQLGRTLFQLLVPLTLEPFFGGTTEMVLQLDDQTAGIPWEMLDTTAGAGGDSRPWAIRAKLLRKLRTENFRPQVRDANAESSILVIGEPECDPTVYPRLPGARAEARAVVERLRKALHGSEAERSAGQGTVVIKALISDDEPAVGPDARTVLDALLERDWRIVHIAGHGELPEKIGPPPIRCDDPPQEDGDPRGVVLSKCAFLGPREIQSMRVVPELVFVNCCHLGAFGAGSSLARPKDHARFAAGVAEALINVGVRCVIAAGWAVDDNAASQFASVFYGALLGGQRFIDAVAAAREAARGKGDNNTWAAYQCYGDPDWTLTSEVSDAQGPGTPIAEEFSGVGSSVGLENALDMIAVQSKYQHRPALGQQDRIRHLEERFGSVWGNIGSVAEAFGTAWAEAGDPKRAIGWYRRAVAANDATASLRATEQLCNLTARTAWKGVDMAARAQASLLKEAQIGGGRRASSRKASSSRAARNRAADRRGLAKALAAAREATKAAIDLMERLVSVQSTMERESILASAYKRQSLIEALAGNRAAETAAIESMRAHYEKAEALGLENGLPDVFYPAMNAMSAELALNAGRPAWKGLDRKRIDAARASLSAKVRDDPDFWSVVGQTELSLYEALSDGSLVKKRLMLESEYGDLHRRVSAQSLWGSVRDQLTFVLSKYMARTKGEERKAAETLLARAGELAGSSQ